METIGCMEMSRKHALQNTKHRRPARLHVHGYPLSNSGVILIISTFYSSTYTFYLFIPVYILTTKVDNKQKANIIKATYV